MPARPGAAECRLFRRTRLVAREPEVAHYVVSALMRHWRRGTPATTGFDSMNLVTPLLCVWVVCSAKVCRGAQRAGARGAQNARARSAQRQRASACGCVQHAAPNACNGIHAPASYRNCPA